MLLEWKKNQRGNFACLSKINRVGRSRFIIIPKGYEGNGWKEFERIIFELTQKIDQGKSELKVNVGTRNRVAINVPKEIWGVQKEEVRVASSVVPLGRKLCIQTRYNSMANNFGA